MSIDHLFSLKQKTAVVIGGGGSLGGEIAHGLADAGANTVIVGRDVGKCETRAEEIRKAGGRAVACQGDTSKKEELQRVLDATLKAFGKVDILVNSAGINSATPFFDVQESEWQRILDVNLKGTFLACQIIGKSMTGSGGGSIINISSASSDPPLSKVFTYSVSKSGVNQITKYLARELAPLGIRVNAIVPGFFPAEQNRAILKEERITAVLNHTPMGRLGNADELRGAAIFLASDRAASFVTGIILRVDGGFGAMTI
jgi:NAD(P)-dependent dehydrogenase (short-subunit alcohol dehydrogenase family)